MNVRLKEKETIRSLSIVDMKAEICYLDFILSYPLPRPFSDTKQKPYATGGGARNPSVLVLHKDQLLCGEGYTFTPPIPLQRHQAKTICQWKKSWSPRFFTDTKQ